MTTISMDEVFSDEEKLRIYYSKCVLLSDLIEDVRPNNVLKCPFHNDHNPSAKLYVNEDGSQNIYCFTENKMYSSYDYVKDVLGVSPIRFLLKNYSEKDLSKELKFIDFSNKGVKNTNSKNTMFDALIQEACDFLPDVVEYLNAAYNHGIVT